MTGWVKLHRELLDKPIWEASTPEQKTILITILALANHKEREWEWRGQKFKARAGQFVTSLPSLVEKSGKGVSVQNVRTALKRFEKLGFLTDESTNQNRLITIVNWGIYQGQESEITDDLTGNQQATNRQLTPNKNVRKKEGKKKDSNRKQVYDEDSPSYKIADFFYKEILRNNPGHKEPNMQAWADDIRKMIELDKRDKSEVSRLIRWVQQDSFEMANVLSPAKLRTRYDALVIKMNQNTKGATIHYMPTAKPQEYKHDINAGEN